MMKTIFVSLMLLFSLALPGHAEISEACRPSEVWELRKTYRFNHQGKSYRLIWFGSGDGSGSLCLAQGNTAQPIVDKYTGDSLVTGLDRLSAQVFTFQVHDGNGNNVPARKYRLDLSNPRQPKVTLLKQWRE
jgi:hypothetical protein